ncbi:D-alanyl-D-alanine carboxypeptidase/D-alanyl-D-alanine-endopeptidase [Pedobacter sp.]|uniref:D-alanyl-D-alanine carboxypeptidase/D-alanyl-D-alanine-endopeptidase n=1 Tax=Pedobacter sp. TaxID=1411316 RepID=UPI003D7F4497
MQYKLPPASSLFFGVLVFFILQSCSVQHRMHRQLDQTFKQSAVVNQYPVGFALYDLENGKMIFEKDADKYFVPASNTKLFTFYAGLKMIPDSIPSLRYVVKGDSLIFWGTGDPSFLQTQLKGTKALEFLKASPHQLYFAPGRYTGDFYGTGWAWDDYNDYYQAEINELPLMDNLITVKANGNALKVSPRMFESCILPDSTLIKERFGVFRDFNSNTFHYPKGPVTNGFKQELPYKVNTITTINLLNDTLHKKVNLVQMTMPAEAKTIYNLKSDSVLKQMMLPSDNFIAEQLLLVYGNQLSTELNSKKTIDYIINTYLKSLPDRPVWVDGSGLSRNNLFTPRDMVALLRLIYEEVNDSKRLFAMLPAGGQSGTLKNAYPATDKPFVFGKTGTLSNVHNQSGYVVTKKGKIYIYSFLNNNFVLPTATVRKEMGRIVTLIHERY